MLIECPHTMPLWVSQSPRSLCSGMAPVLRALRMRILTVPVCVCRISKLFTVGTCPEQRNNNYKVRWNPAVGCPVSTWPQLASALA